MPGCLPHAVRCEGLEEILEDFLEAGAQEFALKEVVETERPSAQAPRSLCSGMTRRLRRSHQL